MACEQGGIMMRPTGRSIVVSLFAIVTSLLLVLLPTWESFAADKKISGTGRAVALLSETKMSPGNDAKHEIALLRRLDADKGTLGEAQVSVVNASDYVAGTGTHRGHRVSSFPDGDKAFSSYEGRTKTVLKSGASPEVTFEGKWWFTGGTGKLTGLTGGGIYTGGVSSTGLTYQYEGEYDVKQPASFLLLPGQAWAELRPFHDGQHPLNPEHAN
jgi:hypothetical protein